MVKNDYMIMRGLTLANSGGQVGELSMQHAHPRILHPKISLCTINVLIWLVTLHMVSYSGVPWKNCVRTGAPRFLALLGSLFINVFSTEQLSSFRSL